MRETQLTVDALIYPVFVLEGHGARQPIAAMPGIDALTIGPADLAQDLGVAGTPDQGRVLDEKRDQILAAARRHGKVSAMLVSSFEEMQRWKAAGVTLLAYSSDADILYSGYASAMKRIKGL